MRQERGPTMTMTLGLLELTSGRRSAAWGFPRFGSVSWGGRGAELNFKLRSSQELFRVKHKDSCGPFSRRPSL